MYVFLLFLKAIKLLLTIVIVSILEIDKVSMNYVSWNVGNTDAIVSVVKFLEQSVSNSKEILKYPLHPYSFVQIKLIKIQNDHAECWG